MNAKSQTVEFDLITMAPVKKNVVAAIPGTQDGNFYNPIEQINGVIVSFRRLNEQFSRNEVSNGPETRIRVIPISDEFTPKQEQLLSSLGLTKKTGTNNQGAYGVHFSDVTTKAADVASVLLNALELI